MTIPSPIDWETIENALHRHFEDATGIQFVWADQRAPQPEYPYGSLNILPGSTALPVLDGQFIKPDGSIKLVGQRDFTVSAQIHVGPPDSTTPRCHGRALMYAAIAALDLPLTCEAFREAGIAIRQKGQPNDLDIEIGGEWISRTQADIRIGVAAVLQDIPATQPGWFDKVEVSSTIKGIKNPGGSLELDEETFDPNA